MSWVKDTFFGGNEKKAAEAQQYNLEQSQQIISENVDRARDDVRGLYPNAAKDLRLGFSGAMDTMASATPKQITAFQGGNRNAQDTLRAGLPQTINALMGAPVDLGGLQTKNVAAPTIGPVKLPEMTPMYEEPAAAGAPILPPEALEMIRKNLGLSGAGSRIPLRPTTPAAYGRRGLMQRNMP